MRAFAQAIDLKDNPEMIAEYVALHRKAWPEVTDALREIGIHSMRIYRGGTRLFMLIETEDNFDLARYQDYAKLPRTDAWDTLMRRYQQPTPFAKPGEWWSPLEEIFDLGDFPTKFERDRDNASLEDLFPDDPHFNDWLRDHG